MGRFSALFGRPAFLRGFHGWMTLGWGALVPITVLTSLKGSIIWIALMSVWANFVGHFSSWQAARVEVNKTSRSTRRRSRSGRHPLRHIEHHFVDNPLRNREASKTVRGAVQRRFPSIGRKKKARHNGPEKARPTRSVVALDRGRRHRLPAR